MYYAQTSIITVSVCLRMRLRYFSDLRESMSVQFNSFQKFQAVDGLQA